MTARVTTLHGGDAGRYYVDGPRGYYLDGDEPPGRWRGLGAVALGLEGEIVDEEFLAIMDGKDPTGTRLLGTAHNNRTVRGFDVTCSAPKSISVLYALGADDIQAQVLAAHDAAVDSVLDWIDGHAHCRYRVDGAVRVFDAEGVTAALFRQHTSRALDSQVHTHVVVANRVLSPDGRWLALDARTLKHDQRTLSALYHAGLRSELTGRLGVRWHEPENGIAEIADIDPVVLGEMSTRTKAVDDRVEVKLNRFAEYFGRPPTPRERWKLEREAVVDSRPPKAKGTNPDGLRADWWDRIAALGVDPNVVVSEAVGLAEHRFDLATDQAIIEKTLAALTERQSTWRPAEITRELAAALPTTSHRSASEIHELIEELRQGIEDRHLVDLTRPVPDGVPRRRDGRPITESAIDRILTTPAILAQEERLLTLAQQRIEAVVAESGTIDGAEDLTAVQREAATRVAGNEHLVLVVGPAGTGKTTALRPAVEHLRQDGRAVFGVAPSATAAEVLSVDAGIDADTLDKLLVEHRLDRPPDHRYDLPAGATIILDEAAMVSTPRLAELFELAERSRWRLALVGDPMQFAAVGRSGMFGYLVETFGAVELDRVHRFAADWERAASLRLRHGDVSVVELYEHHDRLHGGTATQMRRAVVDAWWQATEAGEQASMLAPTREAVAALNLDAQLRCLAAGELNRAGPALDLPDRRLYVGDAMATRRNDRRLRTDVGRMVKNRDHWTVDTIHQDRSLTVSGRTGQVHLPADYVADHVELGYAETSHANQGRTVDRSFLYLDGPTDARGIYVALTRGRATNEAFVVLRGEETPADVVAEALTRSSADEPAITHVAPGPEQTDTEREADDIRRRLDQLQFGGPQRGAGLSL